MNKACLGYETRIFLLIRWQKLLSFVTVGKAGRKLYYSLQMKFKLGFRKNFFFKNFSNDEMLEEDAQRAISIS